jgi:hypothetical protein
MNVHQPDPFEWHRRALAGEKPPLHDSPQAGWYRTRDRLPASIFYTPDGKLNAEIDGNEVDPADAWLRLCKSPVSEDDYLSRCERGYWPDEPAPRSHNQPPEPFEEDSASAESAVADEPAEETEQADPDLEAFLVQIEDLRQTARTAYGELKPDAPQAVANRAMHVVEELRQLSKQIDKLRDERKRPYLDACNAIQNYFRDPIQVPLTIADRLVDRIKAWKKAEDARREAAAEAERQRLIEEQRKVREAEEEARRKAAAEAGEDAPEPEPLPEPEPPVVEPERVMLGGGVSGRRSGGRKVVTAKITDFDAVYQHFKEHADVKAVLQRLANAAIKKQPVPGATKDEDERL